MAATLKLSFGGGPALVAIALLVFTGAAKAQEPSSTYSLIKDLEDQFPIPTPVATVHVGTFDAATGNFAGKVSTLTSLAAKPPTDQGGFRTGPHGRVHRIPVPPQVAVNAVDVRLSFSVTNRGRDFSVTANGVTVSARPSSGPVHQRQRGVDPNQRTLTVNVGDAISVHWTVRSGGASYSDNLVLIRPPIVGVGVFTIPALPIAILYEPPQDREERNQATYSTSRTIGTTVRMSFGQETSTTRPGFSALGDFQNKLGLVASGLEKSSNSYAQAAAIALKTISAGLGEISVTDMKGTNVTEEHALSLTFSSAHQTPTVAHLGPGLGDVIIYLVNARLVWLVADGGVQLLLIGYEGRAAEVVRNLREDLDRDNPETGLDHETIRALLALDPFVGGGPQTALPEKRFKKFETYIMSWGEPSYIFEHTITSADLNATTDFTTHVVDMRKGFLSFLGLGAGETKTVKSTVTHSRSTEVVEQQKAQVRIDLHAQEDERYILDAYFDRVFGTIALVQRPVSGEPMVAGTALDDQGQPQAGQQVMLMVGGDRYTTLTDSQGRYAFYASTTIQPGRGELIIGKKRKLLEIKGKPSPSPRGRTPGKGRD